MPILLYETSSHPSGSSSFTVPYFKAGRPSSPTLPVTAELDPESTSSSSTGVDPFPELFPDSSPPLASVFSEW